MLGINDVSYRIGGRTLFESASVAIPAAARVGLVGRNGSGKTTLFRIIAGEVTSSIAASSSRCVSRSVPLSGRRCAVDRAVRQG